MESVTGTFRGEGGPTIFWRGWPPPGTPRAVVVVAHGVGEHSGRYGPVALRWRDAGYAVYALDHRGHGRSDGPRAFVDRMAHAVADLGVAVEVACRRHPGAPPFLAGHSLGGAIALARALEEPGGLAGLILSAPAVSFDGAPAALRLAVRALSAVAPRLPIHRIDVTAVSRDPDVVAAYRSDPLVHHGALPARTVAELLATAEGFPAALPDLRLPVLVMHGTADRLTSPAGSRLVHDRCGSPDRTLRLYEGLYHEVFNEPERDRVLGDVVDWLDARTGASRL